MRHSQHSVSLGTFGLAFAIALSPALMQDNGLTFSSCKTGDTRLAELAVEVSGQDQITAFDPELRIYDVWLSMTDESAVVRVIPMEPDAQVWVNYYSDSNSVGYMLAEVGGGEFTVDLDPGESNLWIYVKAPGGASDDYTVNIVRSPPEPTDLALLELWVPEFGAANEITAFHSGRLLYDVGLARGEDSAVVRVQAADPVAQITVTYDSVPVALQLGQLGAIDVPRGLSELVVTVSVPPASKRYVVRIDRGTVPPEAVEQFVDDYVAPWLLQDGAGIAVTVIGSDGVEFEKSYGLANIEQSIAINNHTPFQLASVSKQFAATAAMMLYEEGLLHPDDLVLDHFPEGRAEWGSMTLHHLLTHQSGVPDHMNDRPLGGRSDWTNEDVLAYLLETPLEFAPGDHYEYSNSGYVMVALLVERVSGQLYEDFVQERIFTPLGMVDSTVPPIYPPEIPNRAMGYLQYALNESPLQTMGDVGHYSSLEDLRRWELSLRNPTLVSPATLALMFTPHVRLPNLPECSYGYGWFICDGWEGLPFTIDHTGRLQAFTTHILRIPEEAITVVMLANGTFWAWAYDLTVDLSNFLLGYDPAPATKALSSSPTCMYDEGVEPIVTLRGVHWPCE